MTPMPSSSPSTALLALGLLACTGSPHGDSATSVVTCSACTLTDANNYTWQGSLAVDEWDLTAGANVTLSWDDLHHDLYGIPIEPTDVERVVLLAMTQLTPDDVRQAIADDDLLMSDASLTVFCSPEGTTSCELADFELFGNELVVEDYFIEGTGTWLAALLTADDTFASVGLLVPDVSSTLTSVAFSDETAALTLDVDLKSLSPVVVDPGTPLTIDWTALTVDGVGNALFVDSIDQVLVGRFDLSVDQMEDQVTSLETLADPLWTLDVTEPNADLSTLVGDVPFEGIDADGTWLLALYCSSCLNPAPRFVTLLQPP